MNPISANNFYINYNKINGNLNKQKDLPLKTNEKKDVNFGKVVGNLINKVDTLQHKADNSVKDLASGQSNIPEMIVNMNKADIGLKIAVEVRNKAIEAYQEIMKMPI